MQFLQSNNGPCTHLSVALLISFCSLVGVPIADIQYAILYLPCCRQTTAQASDSSQTPKAGCSGYQRQTSHPSGAKRIKKVSRLYSVDPKNIPNDPDIIDLTKDGDDLTQVPTSMWFGKKSKRIPSPNLGFLIQVRATLYDQIMKYSRRNGGRISQILMSQKTTVLYCGIQYAYLTLQWINMRNMLFR